MEQPTLRPCTWMKEKSYRYLPDNTPQLVLYTFAHTVETGDSSHPLPAQTRPNFKTPKKWIDLFHQTAGYACHHVYLHARFLNPLPSIQKLMSRLASEYYESCLAAGSCRLSELVKYEKILHKYGLTANDTYRYLAEGFYPIDGSCLNKVTNERFPKDLQKLFTPAPLRHWLDWSYQSFNIAILTENCD
jgi:hypothetical protein